MGVEGVDHASFEVTSQAGSWLRLGPGSTFTGQSPEVAPRAWGLSQANLHSFLGKEASKGSWKL